MTDFIARLKQRKLVQWAVAYVAAAFALLQAIDIVATRFGWPDTVERLLIIAICVGFFVTLLLAWYHGDQGRQRASGTELLLVALVLAVGGGFLWKVAGAPASHGATAPSATPAAQKTPVLASAATVASHSAPASAVTAIPAKSIAVLPFENLSDDKDNVFFSDGLSEEILNSLARIDGLRVIGRTSSFQFKGKDVDSRTIGARLGVANLLEGSVRREGERARVTAQLIRASDGTQLWSQTYDRTVKDSLAVQLDIAEQVAGVLNVVLDDKQRAHMRAAGVKNVDAFIAYQKGWKLYIEAHLKAGIDLIDGLRRANVEFDKAIALDPNFSFAYFAEADLYEHTLMADGRSHAELLDAQRAALYTLERAAATSPDPQQRDLALAERQLLSDDWHGLADRIETALKQPGCSAPNWMPMFASAFGYGDLIENLGARVNVCDPLNAINYRTRISVALATGHPQRALDVLAMYAKASGNGPMPTAAQAIALAMLGRIGEAQSHARLDGIARQRLLHDATYRGQSRWRRPVKAACQPAERGSQKPEVPNGRHHQHSGSRVVREPCRGQSPRCGAGRTPGGRPAACHRGHRMPMRCAIRPRRHAPLQDAARRIRTAMAATANHQVPRARRGGWVEAPFCTSGCKGDGA